MRVTVQNIKANTTHVVDGATSPTEAAIVAFDRHYHHQPIDGPIGYGEAEQARARWAYFPITAAFNIRIVRDTFAVDDSQTA